MYTGGDIIRRSDMLDPRSGQLSYMFKKLSNLMGTSKKNPDSLLRDDYIVLACVLQVYALVLFSFLFRILFRFSTFARLELLNSALEYTLKFVLNSYHFWFLLI